MAHLFFSHRRTPEKTIITLVEVWMDKEHIMNANNQHTHKNTTRTTVSDRQKLVNVAVELEVIAKQML